MAYAQRPVHKPKNPGWEINRFRNGSVNQEREDPDTAEEYSPTEETMIAFCDFFTDAIQKRIEAKRHRSKTLRGSDAAEESSTTEDEKMIAVRDFFTVVQKRIEAKRHRSKTLRGSDTAKESGPTEDEMMIVFRDFVAEIAQKSAEAEKNKKLGREKYKRWTTSRERTLERVCDISARITQKNAELSSVQAGCKVLSMGAKFAIFGGPIATVIGAGTALYFDLCYANVAKTKIEELEKMSKTIQRILLEDSEETNELLVLMDQPRLITQEIKDCVKKFHSATISGFFDTVPSLINFVNAVKAINVSNIQGITKFLTVVMLTMEHLSADPSFSGFFTSVSGIFKYNPGVLELAITIPGIICNANHLVSAVSTLSGAGATVPATGIPLSRFLKRGMNGLAIISDFGTILKRIGESEKTPELAKELDEIKSRLMEEQFTIRDLARKLYGV